MTVLLQTKVVTGAISLIGLIWLTIALLCCGRRQLQFLPMPERNDCFDNLRMSLRCDAVRFGQTI